ncbi:hypothetical protein B5X24_HaOG204470 [Helicoverpa armigera]|uniref:Major facilitator superfamily (MFS) profile domain-containing protein n=1 Tax=Helicoverpa armigera TaxID=29058 RepID=A0A2W1BSA0_HELAM|nr:hypothetical protein B5X24_HaOG204470 [Helicoverpa armigera]
MFHLSTVTIPLLSFGMVQGWLSPMISVLQSADGPSPEPYTSSDISWMASVTYITAIIFGAPMGYLTDRFGRKLMTLVTALSLIIYWQIKLLNIGYLMSYICADVLSVNTMLWLGLLVPTVTFFIFLTMPETPEYLVKQGKVDEAKTVLAWLRGVNVVDRGVEQDIESIVRVEKQTQADSQSVWKIIMQDKPTFKAFIITLIIKITQQFDGYLIVLIFAGVVFERASESISLKLSPNKQVMMIGVVQLLGSIVATCIVEKTGRKLLLVTTSFAVGVGMLILSAWFYMTSSGMWLPGWLPVLAMCMCIFADAAGFQPISYIIITDLFTFQLRGTVSAFANVCAKMSNFVQTKWFTILCELIGIHWTFLFFAAVCFIACFYSVIYFPETRQKTIDEIYSKLSGKAKKDDSRVESVP